MTNGDEITFNGAKAAVEGKLSDAERHQETISILNEELQTSDARLWFVNGQYELEQSGSRIRRGFWIEVLRATLELLHENQRYGNNP